MQRDITKKTRVLSSENHKIKDMQDIINDLCKAWETLDAELIIKHLDNDFIYDSQWVLYSLNCNKYKEYIQGKFKTLKNNGIQIKASIIDDPYIRGTMLKLNQNGNIYYYRIKIVDDKVIKADMCMF